MTASLLIPPVARFFDTSGAPLAGGKVYTYGAGTLTPKTSYTDSTGVTPNTNPVILDSSGQANIWLDGNYKINLTDANDVQQADYPVDNVSSFTSGSVSEYAVTTGSANAYVITLSPPIFSYQTGQSFNIKINADNTGPVTVNVSGLGAKDVVVPPNYPLVGGELLADNIYQIIYDGTNFQVQNATPAIDIITSAQATAPWGRLPMTGSTIAMTSGGTYNSAIYSRVYKYLWTNYSNSVAPVSGGRGASAAADFAANKTITIPDFRDYAIVGVSGGGSITASGATAGATTVTPTGTVGSTGSAAAGLAPHTHLLFTTDNTSTTLTTNSQLVARQGTFGGDDDYFMAASALAATVGLSGSAGTSDVHSHTGGTLTMNATSVLQKSIGVYWYIKY